jgi:hypothetical protein
MRTRSTNNSDLISMQRFFGQRTVKRLRRLALPGVFLLGILAGFVLARAVAGGPTGDVLAEMALVVLGLIAGLALVSAGFILGARGRTVEEAAPGPALVGEREIAGDGAVVASTPVVSALAADVEQAAASMPPEAARVQPPVPVIASQHLQVLRGDAQLLFRAQDVLGYEALQFTVGLNRDWLHRRPALAPAGRATAGLAPARRVNVRALLQADRIALILFASALAVFAITRLYALDQFPIFFFTDEAIHPVLATELLARGLRDAAGNFLPPYFQNGQFWNLSFSVYLHLITAGLLGKSILVTRATSALFSLLGAAAVGLILKWFFKVKCWWLGVLVLALIPAWFLHSRTAFETVLMVSLYSIFLLFYLLYRYRSPRFLFPTLIFAAATFYSYTNGEAIIGLSGVLFLISDLRYHLKNWRMALLGAGLLLVLAIPYLRFRSDHPDIIVYHLQILDSYWLKPGTLADKVQRFLSTYLYGLSPQYWFFPNDTDLIRHRMKDYGNIQWWQLPFFALGVLVTLRNLKRSEYRALLIALIVAPFGSALADIAITRALLFVMPAAILATLGVNTLIHWIKSSRVQTVAAAAAFAVTAVLSLAMLGDALTNGPTWYNDYGLYGMQWGAKQLFAQEIPRLLQQHPGAPIYVTSTWANGSDVFLRFFNTGPSVKADNVRSWIAQKEPLDQNAIFIMATDEYDLARANPKFKSVSVDHTIQWPDGRDGFFVVHMQYADNVDAVFAAEGAELKVPVTDTVTIDGQQVQVTHTRLEMGEVSQAFDGLPSTVIRGVEANPLVLDLKFPAPRAINGLTMYLGKAHNKVTARVYADDSAQPVEYVSEFRNESAKTDLPEQLPTQMSFDRGPALVSRLVLEIGLPEGDDTVKVHVFDIALHK